ncbi:MAG: GyrI-like domain-containing protein [Coriobacteriia bacterium]|nr:GyrI-like domain-containing protein [Coriobacteriia bacterium]
MFDANIKQTEPTTVAFLSMRGPYSQIPEGYGHLYGWVASHALTPTGMPSAIYLTSPDDVPDEDAVWELWAPLAGQPELLEPDEDGIGVRHIPKKTVASAMYKGPYEEIGATYEALTKWVEGHDYSIVGPPEEVYFSDPEEVPRSEYLTEVRFPVTKR